MWTILLCLFVAAVRLTIYTTFFTAISEKVRKNIAFSFSSLLFTAVIRHG